MINILANNKCIVNVDQVGEFTFTLHSVSGMYNPIILDTNDWIKFSSFTLKVTTRMINITMSQLNEYLSDEYTTQGGTSITTFETDITSMITVFPEAIIDCSDRFKHIYNISTFPATMSNKLVQTNGPMILIIKSKGIMTGMRISDQRIATNENYAATIANIVSVNLNQYSVGFPFTLTGNSYNVRGNQLQNVEFKIVDIYDNDLEFINDLIWCFSFEQIDK